MNASPVTVLLAASDTGKGSPIGLFVVLLLVVAVYLLYRSMTGHLRRLPENFPGYRDGADEAAGPDAEHPVAAPPPGPSDGDEPPRLRPERPA
jgi:hypothetical protein